MSKLVSVKGWILFGVVLLEGTLFLLVLSHGLEESGYQSLKQLVKANCKPCQNVLSQVYSLISRNYRFLSVGAVLAAIILALEFHWPARKGQRTLSTGVIQDFVWFGSHSIVFGSVSALYFNFLVTLFADNVAFLKLSSIATWPTPLQVAFAIVASDFLYWLQHLIKHKVEVFWYFHTIHHSQLEMNLLTSHRIHPVEDLIAHSIMFIPFLSLQLDLVMPTAFAWSIFSLWFSRFQHSNVRTNLGWLRYVLVTPQSHRIHHSKEVRHRDKNFGVNLSIWDYAFGTQYRVYDEYPDTGLEGVEFSYEKSRIPGFAAVAVIMQQLLHPFRLIFLRYKRSTVEV